MQRLTNPWVLVKAHFAVEIQIVLGSEGCVLGIKLRETNESAGHIGHAPAFRIELAGGK